MENKSLLVLTFDSHQADVEWLRLHLAQLPGLSFSEIHARSTSHAMAKLSLLPLDPLVIYCSSTTQEAIDLIRGLHEIGDTRAMLAIAEQDDQSNITEWIRAGADDALTVANVTEDSLRRSIELVLTRYAMRREKAIHDETLRQTQKVGAFGQLAGGIAHDFNNMLTGLLGLMEIILHKSEGRDIQHDVNRMQRICENMRELIERLLMFSRSAPTHPTTVSIRQLLLELEVILRHTFPKNIDVTILLPSDDLYTRAIPSMLQQVFLNICINASEAMPNGGKIVIRARRTATDSRFAVTHPKLAQGDSVVIEFCDTGIGMPPEVMERIFEPFYTTKTVGSRKGAGLGLAVAGQNITEHGGSIHVDSVVGRGTTFTVALACESMQPAPAVPTPTCDFEGGNEGVLLVDDEPIVREVATSLLRRLGYSVRCASSGREAVELFETEYRDISCVILDLAMPGMSGIECLHELLRIDPNAQVILSSGHDLSCDSQHLIAEGAVGLIQKPYLATDFAAALRRVLNVNRAAALSG